MVDLRESQDETWLALRDASAKMGVSPTTLRAWADEGRVASYRTPGGHRRFRVGEGKTFFKPEQRSMDTRWRLLEHTAVGRVELAREANEGAQPPLEARTEHRTWERDLIRLCTQTLQEGSPKAQEDFGNRADALGERRAKMNWRYGISNAEAVRALGIFRTAFLESVVEFAFGIGEPNVDELNLWLRRGNEIIDRVSVSMLEYRSEGENKSGGKR